MEDKELTWHVCTKRTGWRCILCNAKIQQSDRYAAIKHKRFKFCSQCKKEAL
jgi:hypothetical protein